MPTETYIFYGQQFEWDTGKGLQNIEKHGIPFKEAATVFRDDRAAVLDDDEHSQDEERFKIIGMSGNIRLLTVCHCYRSDNSIIRIISARKATKIEQANYRR
ncbi:MAG: BrnT family toxin [Defluviitaleaceae bacterium]|nr:BrnT family toxin [Defluviitaleaceae bacterium]